MQSSEVLLLTGKKRKGNIMGNFLISVDHKNLTVKSDGYVGKLRANFWGTIYNLYDSGENPVKYKQTKRPREQFAAISFV